MHAITRRTALLIAAVTEGLKAAFAMARSALGARADPGHSPINRRGTHP
ncbi:hypothetical protein [Streptomyces sp. MNP-20]|nr:hypothetical protein [Streptomyces sp. MNP-20]